MLPCKWRTDALGSEEFYWEGVLTYTLVLTVFSFLVALFAKLLKARRILVWHLFRVGGVVAGIGCLFGIIQWIWESNRAPQRYGNFLSSALDAQSSVDRMSEAIALTVICGILAIGLNLVAGILRRRSENKMIRGPEQLTVTARDRTEPYSDRVCPSCGDRLRRIQVDTMLGNSQYEEWCRAGFCSLRCFERSKGKRSK
jgi:hypothetical protein